MQDQNHLAAPSEIAQQLFNNLLRRGTDSNLIEPLSDCVSFLKQVAPVCVCGSDGAGEDWGKAVVIFLFLLLQGHFLV